ncbi:MAG TPA: GAF domain-containing protein [Candidatus Bathyarchaeia archaeon]|nr:GAF domain-containing protein [Candidatus Bathyarchaeia archaeon]
MSDYEIRTGAVTHVTAKLGEFPFRSEFSLEPLIRYWETDLAVDDCLMGAAARTVLERVAQVPELRGAATLDMVRTHEDLIDALMVAVFSPTFREDGYGAALLPYRMQTFFATDAFARLLTGPGGVLQGRIDVEASLLARVRIVNTYSLILQRVYGIDVAVDFPWISIVKDPETGLERHFKLTIDRRFLTVQTVGEPPAITEAERRRIRALILEPSAIAKILPPEQFLIRGFSVVQAIEVTEQEVLSSIERDLIEKESIVSTDRFRGLQDKLRALLRRPEVELGLAAIEGDRVLVLNFGSRFEHACIFADSTHQRLSDFAGSIYERAALERRPLFVEDLEAYPERSRLEETMLAAGYKSVVVAPLVYQGGIIGSLKLVSPRPGSLSVEFMPHLLQILPLFAMAVKRSMDELGNRIQAVIKEKCTAIHPVVEWRFRKAVLNSIERSGSSGEGSAGDMEPIVFRDVHPFYALADIRGSSTHRAWAIQVDLLSQLGLAESLLEAAYRARPMAILDQLRHKVERHASAIEVSLRSGEEAVLIAFLKAEVESLFGELETYGPEVRERIEAYRAAIDPQLGAVGTKRRGFEQSVAILNDTITSYLDLEERAAQETTPHYFEKQRTDGVDYSMYAGPSLLEDGNFTPLHLKNLRLWQVMVACGIAVAAERVKPRLPEPLEITSLILVQHAPLAISFRFDEKRFDVDGAYNARYEILKKRIDKAVVKGSTERVTQPGQVAIVYSQASEAAEYRDYIRYLQARGYLLDEVESLELEELQGVSGLRALRVTVNLAPAQSEPTAPRIEAAARADLFRARR